MTKVSKQSASSHIGLPGFNDACEQDVDGWNVSSEAQSTEMDLAPFFRGAPQDLCQARHLGYVIRGRFGVRWPDGREEIFEAGDAFVITPGHTPLMFEDSEYVAFTPADEAHEQQRVVLPDIVRYAQDHGIALPEWAARA
ncbi:cupin domain-containing protein [Jatrophihabitans fulvus]